MKNKMRLMVITFGIFAFLISIMGIGMGQGNVIMKKQHQEIASIAGRN